MHIRIQENCLKCEKGTMKEWRRKEGEANKRREEDEENKDEGEIGERREKEQTEKEMKEKRKKERTHSANIKAASLPASRHKPRFSFGDEGNFDDRPETRSWHNGILIGTPTLPVCLAIHQPATHPSIRLASDAWHAGAVMR